jgi:hypothetical protein
MHFFVVLYFIVGIFWQGRILLAKCYQFYSPMSHGYWLLHWEILTWSRTKKFSLVTTKERRERREKIEKMESICLFVKREKAKTLCVTKPNFLILVHTRVSLLLQLACSCMDTARTLLPNYWGCLSWFVLLGHCLVSHNSPSHILHPVTIINKNSLFRFIQ